jgi:PAS domain S-box-containing protein
MMVTCRLQVLASALLLGWVAAFPRVRLLAGQEPRTASVAAALQDSDGDGIPDRLGQRVALRGVLISNPVVIDPWASRVNLQDSTGGLRLFTQDTALLAGSFREGDVVLVRGTVAQYRGAKELVVEEIRRLGVGPLPLPRDVLAGDLYRGQYQGQLVRLAGELSFASDSAARRATAMLRDRSGEIPVVISPRFFADRRFADRLPRGGRVVLTGIAGQRDDTPPFDSGYFVKPQETVDFAFAPIPPYKAIALTAMVLLLLGAILYLWTRRQRAERRGAELAQLVQNVEQARKSLEASLSLLQATLESTGDGILVVDRRRKIVSYNQKFIAMWNVPESLLEAKDDDRALAFVLDQLKDAGAFLRRVHELYAQPEAESADVLEFKDGRLFERYSRPQYLGEEIVGRVWSYRDVTVRKRAEEALRQSQLFLSRSQEAAHIGSWEADLATGRATWSDELYRLYGLAPQSVPITYQEFLALCHPDDRDRVRTTIGKALKDHRPYEMKYRIVRPDGQTRTLCDRGAVLLDDAGKPVRVLGTGQDITELVQLEEKLALSQKLEAVGQLAGGIAHDFNNLLTAILSYGDLVLEDLPATDRRGADVREIKRAAERASTLTRQLLAFSRRQVLQPKVLDVNAVVGNVEPMLRRLIGEDVELVTALQPQVGRVMADPGQLEQVIMNLAVNARDAMPGGGKLLIETADVQLDESHVEGLARMAPGRYVLLAVSDTGTGMDEATKAHVFEPFFTTKPAGKGTGLGLATVYGIVKQSGGWVWVYSELGHGTTFKIYLPRVNAAADPVAPTATPQPDLTGRETLLLVEDEEAVRKVARTAFEKHGYTVLEAANGGEALRQAETWRGPIHLVVTDVIMPEIGGRELIERLGATRADTRVLFMSGYTDDAIVRHGVLQAGIPFLEKPFTPRALVGAVRRALDSPE